MNIGNNIKRLRESRGMSQYALANLIGVSQQSIDQWERGKSAPRKKNMDKLATLFHVTPNDLFGIYEQNDKDSLLIREPSKLCSEEHRNLLAKYNGASSDVKNVINAILDNKDNLRDIILKFYTLPNRIKGRIEGRIEAAYEDETNNRYNEVKDA